MPSEMIGMLAAPRIIESVWKRGNTLLYDAGHTLRIEQQREIEEEPDHCDRLGGSRSCPEIVVRRQGRLFALPVYAPADGPSGLHRVLTKGPGNLSGPGDGARS